MSQFSSTPVRTNNYTQNLATPQAPRKIRPTQHEEPKTIRAALHSDSDTENRSTESPRREMSHKKVRSSFINAPVRNEFNEMKSSLRINPSAAPRRGNIFEDDKANDSIGQALVDKKEKPPVSVRFALDDDSDFETDSREHSPIRRPLTPKKVRKPVAEKFLSHEAMPSKKSSFQLSQKWAPRHGEALEYTITPLASNNRIGGLYFGKETINSHVPRTGVFFGMCSASRFLEEVKSSTNMVPVDAVQQSTADNSSGSINITGIVETQSPLAGSSSVRRNLFGVDTTQSVIRLPHPLASPEFNPAIDVSRQWTSFSSVPTYKGVFADSDEQRIGSFAMPMPQHTEGTTFRYNFQSSSISFAQSSDSSCVTDREEMDTTDPFEPMDESDDSLFTNESEMMDDNVMEVNPINSHSL